MNHTLRYTVLLVFFCCFGNMSFSQVNEEREHDLNLKSPITYEAYYDLQSGKYIVYAKIGSIILGQPVYMTVDEYNSFVMRNKIREYFQDKSKSVSDVISGEKKDPMGNLIPAINVKSKLFEVIFGGSKIELIPSGYASVDLGILYQKIDNPQILPQNRTNFTIDLQQRIRLSVLGKVGENVKLTANYDTQAGFAFENKFNIAWKPSSVLQNVQNKLNDKKDELIKGEDNILKSIEFGNVNFPLSTSLITGAEALEGVKIGTQFGKTSITTVFSQQQSEARNIVVQGNSLLNTFKIKISEYEENQHYFVSHYFRNSYDQVLANYPQLQSNISITRMEVWKIDQSNSNLQNQRSLVALRDLGENATAQMPNNGLNTVYSSVAGLTDIRNPLEAYNSINGTSLPDFTGANVNYVSGENFSYTTKARLLNTSEYSYHRQLGTISLNQSLTSEQFLAVAFEFTINGSTQTFKVGEFANETNGVLIVKLLKPNSDVRVQSPLWNLMMKNIYSLEASQISQDKFFLNVSYQDPVEGKIYYLPDATVNNQQFIKLMNWDRLNLNGDATNSGQGDGIFDFVPGITINPEQGKVMFTKVEPFGSYLTSLGVNSGLIFNDLYREQKNSNTVQSNPLNSRYSLEGRFSGTQGGGIPLGAINVPRGSVKVTANGQELQEGADYIVDYQMGRVNIINETVKNSGVPINISLENQSAFNMQRKRFMGINVDHLYSDKLRFGLTALNYQERPLTQKAQYGVEPVNNSIFGINLNYQSEAPILTKLANLFPGVKTEAQSNLTFNAEAAYLLPGTNNAIENQSYVDDFDETASRISLKDPNMWYLASSATPVLPQPPSTDILGKGFGRAQTSWYNIDPRFYGVGGGAPSGINQNSLSQHMTRRIRVDEIYSNRDFIAGEMLFMNTFDLTMYPQFKGPYNNDDSPIEYNNSNMNLARIQERWGGIMRSLSVTNFQQANIENVEFWVMDPYADQNTNPNNFLGDEPKLLLHLGNVSEDINADSKLLYENGLPTPDLNKPIDNTQWGKFPTVFPLVYAYETENEARRMQDAGYDGILSDNEPNVSGTIESQVYTQNTPYTNISGAQDAALDDYVFYNSDAWGSNPDVRQRYRYFRNPEGNSPSGTNNASTTVPDAEDVNRDYNLDLTENYNQYTVNLKKTDLVVGQNFIVDEKIVDVTFENGQTSQVKWYLFRIPVKQYDAGGSESVLNNARYIRLFLQGCKTTTTLRFASLDLLRTDWRIYSRYIYPGSTEGDNVPPVNTNNLEIGSVDFETNGNSQPPYTLPPGIIREELQAQGGIQSQNESSMYLKADPLFGRAENASRGVFKNMQLDMRRYKKLKVFLSAQNPKNMNYSDYDSNTKFFIRLGSDLSENYYEYEISLKYTPKTAISAEDIWPEQNRVDLDLDWFTQAKMQRDEVGFSLLDRYENFVTDDALNKKITVKGRPSLGNITTVMLGVRSYDVLNQRAILLWINELRLAGMDNEGGWAATTNLNFNLADFAQVDASGSYKSVGFGALNQGPTERSQEEIVQYNVNTSVNVDKMLPKNWGIRLPVQYSYGEQFITPKYNPLDNDIEMDEAPNRDELKKVVQTYTQNKTIALPSFKKDRTTNKKQRFYDFENLTFSFLYSDTYFRDIYTVYNVNQTLQASVDYTYNFKSKSIEPFKKLKYVQDSMKISKYLQWIKEVNVNPVPTRVSFRTGIMRTYNEFQFRDINALLSGTDNSFNSIYTNNFIFGWQYNVGFNLTRNLKLDINSSTRTLVDEVGNNVPNQRLIWENLTSVGRPVNYMHDIKLNYKLPLQFFPFLDFAQAEIGYNAKYDWTARSTVVNTTENNNKPLGNLAQNTSGINAMAQFDFNTMYNHFKSYKKYDSIKIGRQRELDSLTRAYEANAKLKKPKKFKSYKFKNKYRPLDYAWMILSSVKTANLTYTQNEGTSLPGFLGEPSFFGYSNMNGDVAPTFGFLFGSQADIRKQAFEENWLTRSEFLLEPYFQTSTKNLTANIQIEPAKDFKIDLNFLRNEQISKSQAGYNVENGAFIGYRDAFMNEMASFNSTIISFKTAFSSNDEIFNSIRSNSLLFSNRVAEANGAPLVDADANGYIDGYDLTNADVLIPSFYAAMTGQNASKTKLSYKKGFPLPNWNVTYSGLKNIPFINNKFQRIELNHGYISNYAVNGIQSNLNYYNDSNGLDLNSNRYNYYSYNSVAIQESFAPLLGINATLRNNMLIRAEYNIDRMSLLSLNNTTLQDDRSVEYVIGIGYIWKDFPLKLRYRGKVKTVKNDLNFRLDFSIRDNETRLRRILEDDVQITAGQNIFALKFSADYNVSKSLNLKLFYDQQVTKYKISTAFPLSTVRAGISATFQFGK